MAAGAEETAGVAGVAGVADVAAVAADLVPSVSAWWAPHIGVERCNAEGFSPSAPSFQGENNTARRC